MDSGPRQMSPRRVRLLGAALLAGVAIMVLVVSVLLRPDTTDDHTTRIPRPTAERPLPTEGSPEVFAVAFADRRNGFALRGWCQSRVNQCEQALLATTDGKHWTERPYPVSGRTDEHVRQLLALGPCRVATDVTDAARGTEYRLFSDDCGRDWRRVPLLSEGVASAIPAGAILQAECRIRGDDPDTCVADVVVTMPDTGRRTRLSTAPALDKPSPLPVPLADGGWWVLGFERGTDRPAVAVSHDDGRTWSVWPIPREVAADPRFLELTAWDGDAYVVLNGVLPGGGEGVLAIFHSADGGDTWRRTWSAREQSFPRGLAGSPIARPGDLLMIDRRSATVQWRSDNHGKRFSAVKFAPIQPRWTRAGYLGRSSDDSPWYLSADGLRWDKLAFPTR